MQTSARKGSVKPSRSVYVKGLPSFYDHSAVKVRLSQTGVNLLEWQEFVLSNALSIENGGLKYRNIGISVPRQNGKSEIIIARAIVGLIFLKDEMVYSSYREDSANDIFKRVLNALKNSPSSIKAYFPFLPSEKVKEKTITSIDPHTGKKLGHLRFITRKGGSGRGMSESLIFIDEAQDLTAGENAAITAATATFTNSQVWYFGTPEPAESGSSLGNTGKGGSSMFGEVRRKILKNESKNSFWAEWGVQKMVPPTDVDAWYVSNPSLGYIFKQGRGITEEFLSSRMMDDASFAVEHLGFWSEQEKNSAIEITKWNDLVIEGEKLSAFKGGKVSLAIKSDPDERFIEIVAAIRKTGTKEVFVEVMKVVSMDGAWESQVWDFITPYISSNSCKSIIIDGHLAKSQIKSMLIQNGKWRIGGNNFRQGKIQFAAPSDLSLACSLLLGSVNESNVFHSGQTNLDIAVADVQKRMFRSGSGYGFSSISGKTSASLVETAAMALFCAANQKIEKDVVVGGRTPMGGKRVSLGSATPMG